MPPAAACDKAAAASLLGTISAPQPGDVLWARAGGHGWWPGQVMDPATAQHAQHSSKPNTCLLNFFGDNTIGFFPHSLLQPFEAFKAQALQAQKLKTAKAKAYFHLAVEQAQEMLDRRAGRPAATDHSPVDFTRPETWPEGWGHGEAAGEGGPQDADADEQLRMCYPADPSTDDVAAASAQHVLQLLRLLAVAPHLHTSEAAAGGEAAVATAALRQLWSLLHTRAVQQHGEGACSKCFHPRAQQPTADAEADGGGGGAAAAGSDAKAGKAAGKAKAAGSKRKAAAATASDGAAAPGGKRARGARGAAAAAGAAGDDGCDESVPLSECREAVDQHEAHLLAWGGSISQITLEQVQQQLVAAATDPHQFVRSWAGRQFKAVAVLMRWREAAMAQSTTRREGRLPTGLQGALERAEAMPIASPGLPASLGPGEQQRQGQARLLAASGLGGRRGRQQGAAAATAVAVVANSGRGGSSSSDDDDDDDGDDDDSNSDGGSKGKEAKRRRQARAGRGAAAASPVQAALADLKTACEGGRQQRQALLQRRAAAAVEDAGDSDSDFDDAEGGGGGSGGRKQQQRRRQQQRSVSPTAPKAAAAAARGEQVSVACYEYAAQVPDSREAFNARLQRFLGESGQAASLSKSLSKPGDDSTDIHTLFKLVAALGGSAAVTKRGAWTAVAKDKAWAGSGHRALSGARLKAVYDRRLAAFERSFTARAPVKHITIRLAPPPAATAAAAGGAGGGGGRPAAAGASGARGKPPPQTAAAAAAASARLADRNSRQQKLAAAGLGGDGMHWQRVNSIWRGSADGPPGTSPQPPRSSTDRQRAQQQQQHHTESAPSHQQHQQQQPGGGGGTRPADLRRLLLQFSPDDAAPPVGDVFLAARRFEPSLLSSAVVNQTLVPRSDRLRFLTVTFSSVAAAQEAEAAFARDAHRLLHLNPVAVQVRVKRVDANDVPARRPHQQQQRHADRDRGGWPAQGSSHGTRYEPLQGHHHQQQQQQQQAASFYSAAPPLHQQHMPGIPGLSGGGVVTLPGGIVALPAAAMQQPAMVVGGAGAPQGLAYLPGAAAAPALAPPVDPRRALQQQAQQQPSTAGMAVDVNALLSMLQSSAPLAPPPGQQ